MNLTTAQPVDPIQPVPPLLAAAAALEQGADLVAPATAGRDEYKLALDQATTAFGLIRTHASSGYPPVVQLATEAAGQLMAMAFTAIAPGTGAGPSFVRPEPARVAVVVDAARRAAEQLRATS